MSAKDHGNPSVTRRRFLGFTVGAAAGTALGVPASRTLSDLVAATDRPVYPPRGHEDFVLSVCTMCSGGCGVRVRRVGGRAVKVDGNPLHPINQGRLCPRGQASLQALYHPDRVPGPLRRVGPRGALSSFQPIAWDEALDAIATPLKKLRGEGRPEALALICSSTRGLTARLAAQFTRAFGSPNLAVLDRGEETAALALFLGQGVRAVPVYDLQSTDYVLSVGAALLEAWSSPVYMMRAYGEFRQGRSGRRGKLVQIEPRQSITATSADEWIAVRPGSEGILALGVAQVLVAEGIYDSEFVRLRTNGLEGYRDQSGAWNEGLRNYLEREYSLERVSYETGVSVNTILRLAREFASARSKVAIGPRRGPLLPGTLFDHLATQVLNALAGNLDSPGGVLVPEEVPLPPWALPADPVAEAGRSRPRLDGAPAAGRMPGPADPDQLLGGLQASSLYPLEVLMVVGADPVFASAAPERLIDAIDKIPLVVSFASLPDDTALQADYILPEAHFLESWDLHITPPGVPYPLVSLAQPVVEKPVFDARPAAEVLLALARRIGAELEQALPWQGLPDLIRKEVDDLYAARRGAIMGTPFDAAWVRMMEGAGWWAPGYRSAEELWAKMKASGGWWDPFYDHLDWRRVFQTSSSRYEFRTDLLRQLVQVLGPTGRQVGAGGGGGAARPGAGTRDQAALSLFLFEPLPIAGGSGAELPFLQELLDPGYPEAWETWVEIHPETAAQLGLKDRIWVQISSAQGSIRSRLRLTTRVVTGLVAIPVGLGKRGGGRWAAGRGVNPLRLQATLMDPIGGQVHYGPTEVDIEVVGPEMREPRRSRRG